jgi:uncharacterized phage-associated protein
MFMATSARAVANEFLRLAEEDGRALTPLQIIKLVYIAHGWMLALYQRPLITDCVEAWKYGPVIPQLYHDVNRYGAGSITGPLPDAFPRSKPLDPQEIDLIHQVYNLYGRKNGVHGRRLFKKGKRSLMPASGPSATLIILATLTPTKTQFSSY